MRTRRHRILAVPVVIVSTGVLNGCDFRHEVFDSVTGCCYTSPCNGCGPKEELLRKCSESGEYADAVCDTGGDSAI